LNPDSDLYEENPWDDEPILGDPVAADFLPSPEEVERAIREQRYKVHIALDPTTMGFFLEEGKRLNIPYPDLIHTALNEYIARHKQP